MNDIENKLVDWINNIFHFNGLSIKNGEEFKYNYEYHIIYITKKNKPQTFKYFKQFIYEYGASAAIIDRLSSTTLAFLHELAHCLTKNAFDDIDMIICDILKEKYIEEIDSQSYWEVPDEFAANMFMIDFINENPEAVAELDTIFKGWF